MLVMHKVAHKLQGTLEPHRDAERAPQMSAYMKNKFPFLGIATPLRRKLVKAAFQQTGALKAPIDADLILALWAMPEREYHYAACDYLDWQCKRLGPDHLTLLERLIVSNSWWDAADSLRSSVGELVLRFPDTVKTLDGWAAHKNMWLRRVAIIHQLGFKAQTDEARLFAYIEKNSADPEFFIRKAIGWALRDYSYVDPETVTKFVADHPDLSVLSKREALKALSRRAAKTR
jgi:3-methyladenine DNA glycosylase AlkD